MRIGAITAAVFLWSTAGCELFSPPAARYLSAPECGAPQQVSPPPELARWPVLQAVTATAAVVTWGVRSDASARVRYGLGYARTATAAELGVTMIGGAPLRLLAARMPGLEPGGGTCYQIELGGQVLATGLRVRSAPAVTGVTVRFNVLGDFGAGTWAQRRVRAQLEQVPADLLITTGDNAYPDGTFEEFEARVFDVYRHIFSRMPVFPSAGNHDYRSDDARPYLTEFVLPENAWRAADRERYYSFDWGPVHFVALDTERPLKEVRPGAGDDMADWLAADLAAHTRPWTVVYLHRPPFTASARHKGNAEVASILVPLFEAHGVDVVFAGHNHIYERFKPRNGVTYVTTGGGGAHAYPAGESPDLELTSDDYHFVAAEAGACTFTARAVNASGEEIDRFTFTRCAQ